EHELRHRRPEHESLARLEPSTRTDLDTGVGRHGGERELARAIAPRGRANRNAASLVRDAERKRARGPAELRAAGLRQTERRTQQAPASGERDRTRREIREPIPADRARLEYRPALG